MRNFQCYGFLPFVYIDIYVVHSAMETAMQRYAEVVKGFLFCRGGNSNALCLDCALYRGGRSQQPPRYNLIVSAHVGVINQSECMQFIPITDHNLGIKNVSMKVQYFS